MNIAATKQMNIVDFLCRIGRTPNFMPGGDAFCLSPLHDERTPSFHIDESGTRWYDFGLGRGGDILDLVSAIYHTGVSDSLRILEDGNVGVVQPDVHMRPALRKSNITDITESEICETLLRYSRSRGISDKVTKEYCVQVNYNLGMRHYFAIGFRNNIGGYEIRNSFCKMVIGKKDVTLVSDLVDCPLLVFEGFFDFLSAVQLGWFDPMSQNALILNSTAMLQKSLFFFSQATRILCLLDNDSSGRQATSFIKSKYSNMDDYSHLYSGYKDLNAFLIR